MVSGIISSWSWGCVILTLIAQEVDFPEDADTPEANAARGVVSLRPAIGIMTRTDSRIEALLRVWRRKLGMSIQSVLWDQTLI